jgi:hypothetical protein
MRYHSGAARRESRWVSRRRLPDNRTRTMNTDYTEAMNDAETTDKYYAPPAFSANVSPCPEVLYHYTGQAGLLSIINTAELWATKIQYMNDATEFNLALSIARQILDERIGGILGIGGVIESVEKAAPYAVLRDSLAGLVSDSESYR